MPASANAKTHLVACIVDSIATNSSVKVTHTCQKGLRFRLRMAYLEGIINNTLNDIQLAIVIVMYHVCIYPI
jgi:hypothetical protein